MLRKQQFANLQSNSEQLERFYRGKVKVPRTKVEKCRKLIHTIHNCSHLFTIRVEIEMSCIS
ncbi:MAG: hypothetical protein C5B50_23370 [Verrucomicrobia bacterium]|nr:MAG: hypothetical protein C5B50_23370 [Verrucomicrobiota bacterium]